MLISNLTILSALFIGIFSSIPSGMALSTCTKPDKTKKFKVSGLYYDPMKKFKCSKINNVDQKYCTFPKVKDKCTMKCCNGGYAKGKDTSFQFYIDEKKNPETTKKYSCVWAGKNNKHKKRCAKFPIVKELCSGTCATQTPSTTPSSVRSNIPTNKPSNVSQTPSTTPSLVSSNHPTNKPSTVSQTPSTTPSLVRSNIPTNKPSTVSQTPSTTPSLVSSNHPTNKPTPFATKVDLSEAVEAYCENPTEWDESESFVSYGHIKKWDISLITDFTDLFKDKKQCNPDISAWDVSHVTAFNYMFKGASNFNANIGAWDVTSSTSFHGMFSYASKFNEDIGTWDVSSSETFNYMFKGASNFNADIGNWDVSASTRFNSMFKDALNFNVDIGKWNVSSSEHFYKMFSGADSFDIEFLCPWHAKNDLVKKNNNMCPNSECDWNVCSQ